jgi:DNA-binding MarR family transcriptional regulator
MMAFWNRWFSRKETRIEFTQPIEEDRELTKQWLQSMNDLLTGIKQELQKIPSQTVAVFNETFEDKSDYVLNKLDAMPDKITKPLGEIMNISKREILAELVRISSRYDTHHSHDSDSAQVKIEDPIQDVTRRMTGTQKRLLGILLDSGFLSYKEIGEKLGITHESAKNLVNRLLKDGDKARLFSKQETDDGIMVGVSSEVQDEILKKKYRTISDDSN